MKMRSVWAHRAVTVCLVLTWSLPAFSMDRVELRERIQNGILEESSVEELLPSEFSAFCQAWFASDRTRFCHEFPKVLFLTEEVFGLLSIAQFDVLSAAYVTCTDSPDPEACQNDWSYLFGQMPLILLHEQYLHDMERDAVEWIVSHEVGHYLFREARRILKPRIRHLAHPEKVFSPKFNVEDVLQETLNSSKAWGRWFAPYKQALDMVDLPSDPEELRSLPAEDLAPFPNLVPQYLAYVELRRKEIEKIVPFFRSNGEELFARIFDGAYFQMFIDADFIEYGKVFVRTTPDIEKELMNYRSYEIEMRDPWEFDVMPVVWERLLRSTWATSSRIIDAEIEF